MTANVSSMSGEVQSETWTNVSGGQSWFSKTLTLAETLVSAPVIGRHTKPKPMLLSAIRNKC
jgi:hypothetical protein